MLNCAVGMQRSRVDPRNVVCVHLALGVCPVAALGEHRVQTEAVARSLLDIKASQPSCRVGKHCLPVAIVNDLVVTKLIVFIDVSRRTESRWCGGAPQRRLDCLSPRPARVLSSGALTAFSCSFPMSTSQSSIDSTGACRYMQPPQGGMRQDA